MKHIPDHIIQRIILFRDCFVSVNLSAIDKIYLGVLTFSFHSCNPNIRITFPQALLVMNHINIYHKNTIYFCTF